jgi:O-antigen ligase
VAFNANLLWIQTYSRAAIGGFGGAEEGTNSIAMVAGAGLAIGLGVGERSWWRRAGLVAASLLMVHVVLFSESRGGMLGLAVAGAAAFLVIRKQPVHYAAILLVLAVCARLAGEEVRTRFSTAFASADERDPSAQSRLELWSDMLNESSKHPILGIGPNQWPEIAPDYGWQRGKEGHSLWLQSLAEMGVPALLLLASFYGLVIWRLVPIARDDSPDGDPWLRGVAIGIISGLCGFAMSAQFISAEALEIPYYLAVAGAGIVRLDHERLCRHSGFDGPLDH